MHKLIGVTPEPSVIGVNNGISQVEIDRKNLLREDGSFYNFFRCFNDFSIFQRQEEAFSFEAPVIQGKKLKKAKMTDIMGYGPKLMALKWLVSDKFRRVLKNFNIEKHKYFEANIEECAEKYYFLFKKYVLIDEFVYKSSVISTGQKDLNNYEEFTFDSYDEYLAFRDYNPLCEFRVVAVDKKFEKEDIIYTQGAGYYFSERLIKSFEDERLTGLELSNYCSIKFV